MVEEPKKEEPKIDIKAIEVVDYKEVKPVKKIEEDVYFTLEDYTELEENLSKEMNQVYHSNF